MKLFYSNLLFFLIKNIFYDINKNLFRIKKRRKYNRFFQYEQKFSMSEMLFKVSKYIVIHDVLDSTLSRVFFYFTEFN